ncbi:hypothetical protein MBAV_004708, partial [Candidatus Magnetobacterium bavaricum]
INTCTANHLWLRITQCFSDLVVVSALAFPECDREPGPFGGVYIDDAFEFAPYKVIDELQARVGLFLHGFFIDPYAVVTDNQGEFVLDALKDNEYGSLLVFCEGMSEGV